MLRIDDEEIKQYVSDLKTFRIRAYPFVTKSTVNQAAFITRRFAQGVIRNSMVTRNRFTEQSVRVEQARTLAVSRQFSTVGSIAPYMADQEFGAVRASEGKHGTPISTSYAAGQEGAQPRTRLPRRPNKLANIRLRKRAAANRRGVANRKQVNLVAVKKAAGSGSKYVFLDLGRTKGLFRVLGGKRRPRIKMVWDLSRRSVVIPSNPWLKPSVDKTTPQIPRLYRDALVFQLRRHNLFKG